MKQFEEAKTPKIIKSEPMLPSESEKRNSIDNNIGLALKAL